MSKKFDTIIRRAEKKDIFSMIELLGELFDIERDFAFDFNLHQRGLNLLVESEKDAIFVCEVDAKVVGMISVQRILSTAMGSYVGLIEDVVVKKEFQKSGIGSKLIDEAKLYSRQCGYERIHLLCDEDNPPAEKFYKKLKFKKSDLRAWYYFL